MLKIKRVALLLSLALLAAGGRAEAAILAADNVPAATLLLPYFEVDLGNPNGVTTLFSINNASATAILAHVVLWTDLGVPSYGLNVYLTGYDIQTVNIRDLLNGNFPQTASAGQDPNDTISPKGVFSQDINFASCNGKLPPPALPPAIVAELQAAHTGGAAATLFGGGCGGQAFGDNVARGYITIDTVNNCTPRSPGDVGYFGGDVTNQNVLWGDYFFVNPAGNVAEGDALIAVEAAPGTGVLGSQPSDPATTTANHYTFYGRYNSWMATDNREPLGSKFAARFVNGGAFTGGTRFFVWRDPKVAQGAFVCPVVPGVKPAWYPLPQEDAFIFDEQENPTQIRTRPFPAATNAIQIGGPSLPVPVNFGWIYLDLNAPPGLNVNPTFDPQAEQAVVSNLMTASGRFAVGQRAIVLENAGATRHTCIGGGSPPCPNFP